MPKITDLRPAFWYFLTYILCLFLWSIFYFVPSDVQSFKNLFDLRFVYPNTVIVNDWHKELSYLAIVKEAIESRQLPWFVENLSKIVKGGDEFVGLPVYLTAPHALLLVFFNPFEFHLLNHLLCLSIGFVGCIIASKHWNFTFSTFIFFTLTFNFYGGFALKIAAYGPSMMGYYLSIFVILCLDKMYNDSARKEHLSISQNSISLAFILSTILYLGSLHYFVQWITFIIFWSLFNRKLFFEVVKAGVLTILITAPRLFPAVANFGFDGNPSEVMGYMPRIMFFEGFYDIRLIIDEPAFSWWEYNNYISAIGIIAVMVFAVFPLCRKQNRQNSIVMSMFPAGLIVAIISFWKFKAFLVPHFIPLLNAESLTSRYIFIPVLLLLLFASKNYSKSELQFNLAEKLFCYAMIALHVVFLATNLFYWRLDYIFQLVKETPSVADEYIAITEIAAVHLNILNSVVPSYYQFAFWLGVAFLLTGLMLSAFIVWKLRFTDGFARKTYDAKDKN